MQLVLVVEHSPQFVSHSWQIVPERYNPLLQVVHFEAESTHVLQLAEQLEQVFEEEIR